MERKAGVVLTALLVMAIGYKNRGFLPPSEPPHNKGHFPPQGEQ